MRVWASCFSIFCMSANSDPATVITSATHRRDGEHDPVFTTTLDDLQKAIDKSGNIPRDAVTMANLIMSTCINMLHTPFLMNTSPRGAQPSSLPSEPPVPASNLGMDSRKPEDLSKGSIRPAQSDSIDLPETRTVCISEIFANATAEAVSPHSLLSPSLPELAQVLTCGPVCNFSAV